MTAIAWAILFYCCLQFDDNTKIFPPAISSFMTIALLFIIILTIKELFK